LSTSSKAGGTGARNAPPTFWPKPTRNGKLRGDFQAARDASQEELKTAALALDKVKPFVDGKTLRKVVVVPGKLVNIVV
jgi:leucyl-tRNA synthetase